MDGLEISEVAFSNIDLGDRYDAEYFTKEYLDIEQQLKRVTTKKLGALATAVASAFYPAATQLYSIGDTAFVRCVDCVKFPIITNDQDDQFEKIPYSFGKENKGISFLKKGEIVVTKVGTPCYASIVDDYEEVALSRTVMGLSNIHGIDAYYLMVFLRCKYGFEQLFRQRELTIQYQLTLPRIKAVNVFVPSEKFQNTIRDVCSKYLASLTAARTLYSDATNMLEKVLNVPQFSPRAVSVKSVSDSFRITGRLDAEYYQEKYQIYEAAVQSSVHGYTFVRDVFSPVKEKCLRDLPCYNYIEIGDVNVETGNATFNVIDTEELPDNAKIMTKRGDLLVSTVRPNRGAVAILENDDFLVSGAFTVLRENGDYPKEMLQVLLRTSMYRDWLLRFNVGTSYPVIKDEDVLNMPIPLLEESIKQDIVNKVNESASLRCQSNQLFEYAKQAVEMAIEHGEDSALEWLRDKV